MKKVAVKLLIFSIAVTFLGCSKSEDEMIRIEEDKYHSVKFEYQNKSDKGYKIVYQPEDISRLLTILNNFMMEKTDDPIEVEDWIYKITFSDKIDIPDDKQNIVFSRGKDNVIVLISKNFIQIDEQVYKTTLKHLETIQSKYDHWDQYDEN